MIQLRNGFLRITLFAVMVLITVINVSFNNRHFVFDGGIILNPNMIIRPHTAAPEIRATDATGCGGAVAYQWQQSFDAKNFVDVPNATATSCRPVLTVARTNFRRRAICSGIDTAYTNMATVIVQ